MNLIPILGFCGVFVGMFISYFTTFEIEWLKKHQYLGLFLASIYLLAPFLFVIDTVFGSAIIFTYGLFSGTLFFVHKYRWRLVWIATICFFAGWLIQSIML